MAVNVHPTAVVSPTAQLGTDVTVGPYAVIGEECVIGDGTTIGPHAVVAMLTTLGKHCSVHAFASVGSDPQDLKFRGERTVLEVGDRCTIREYVTLNRGTLDSGKTTIGSDCLFMANSHVGHDSRVGNRVILANSVALGGHVVLGDWVIIGGLTPVHQFCKVGDHAMIGGGFRVVKDVPPYVLAGQEPLVFEGLNSVGLRRRGISREAMDVLDKAFEILYRSNLNVSQAVSRIRDDLPSSAEIQNLLGFIAASKRGIIPGRSRHRS